MTTIVVGYDGHEAAQRALERAIEEALERKAHLVVVAVVEMPLNPVSLQTFGTLDDSPAPMIPLVAPPELAPIFAAARERIEAAAIPAEYSWAAGEPADAIVGEARDRKAELIVVGSHHHGFFSRVLGADVAAEIRRSAGCDVLVVE